MTDFMAASELPEATEVPVAQPRGTSRAGGLGRLSIWIVPIGMLVQGCSLVQQAAHLFAPDPGERVAVVVIMVVTVVLGVLGVAAGVVAVRSREGRRTGALGASLGIATLVLYGVASWLLWALLSAFG